MEGKFAPANADCSNKMKIWQRKNKLLTLRQQENRTLKKKSHWQREFLYVLYMRIIVKRWSRPPPPSQWGVPIPDALTLRPRNTFLQPRDHDGNHTGASGVEGDYRRRYDLYACEVRTEIQSVIDYFSLNFCFLAAEVSRKAAGD